MNYLYQSYLRKEDCDAAAACLSDLNHRLDPTKQLEARVLESFPINSFGNPDDQLFIAGSKHLLDAFELLDNAAVKTDCLVRFGDLHYMGIEAGRISLQFPVDDGTLTATSVYDFYDDFLNLFNITKYINYCCTHDYNALIEYNLQQLFSANEAVEKQFRLISLEDRETYGIRGITSARQYNNYDNNVVIYLSLLALHKHASENQRSYHVHSAFISDSFIRIVYEMDDPIQIEGVGEVFIGLSVSNGEIRNYKFKMELRYRIVNVEQDQHFAGVYDSPLLSIRHDMTLQTVDSQLQLFNNLENYERSIIEFITNMRQVEKLSEDAAYSIFHNLASQIKYCSNISSRTKESFSNLEASKLIDNTLSLIELFDMAQKVVTDMDEKVFVERIFHKVLKGFLATRKD